ncbi:MAG: MATE family efflux transporter, partial [Anaerovoracaceae bacterium]
RYMRNNIYEQESLSKLIFAFGIPSILSLIIEMLTGVVDTAFAGNLPGVGESALSSMALISPMLGIFTALQTLFAMSTGILIARYMNNEEQQNRSYVAGVIMTVVVAVVTSLLCYITLPQILSALGASGEILDLAKDYMQIQLISNIFSSIGYTLTCCIRAFGYPKIEVIIITSAVFINIIFNYIFAFTFHMDMAGLALGTFVSEFVCASLSVIFLIKKKLWLKKVSVSISWFTKSVFELFKIGISQTVIQILGGCTGFIINGRLLSLGTMTHVAAWSVVQRLYSLILMPIVGLTQGVQNIISYFGGNHQQEKTKKVSKLTMMYCSSYGIFSLVVVILCGDSLLSIFGGAQEMMKVAETVLLVVFAGFPFIGILYTDMTLLQVTGHEVASVMLILSRQIFFLIPLIYLVPYLVGLSQLPILPVMALFLCMPIADLLATIFSLFMKKRLSKQESIVELPESSL